MSSQTAGSSFQAGENLPVDKAIFYRRPGDDMELRLAKVKSSDSALRNAAGFDESEYTTFKDILQKTARKHLDLNKETNDQDQDQWQIFVNELWDSKLGYMMENYEENWPMMVYIHKYLAHTSRDGRRKKAKADRRAKMKMSRIDKAFKPEEEPADADIDTKHGSDCTETDNATGSSSDMKTAIRPVEKMVSEYSAIVKGKENVPSEEGHKVGSKTCVSRKPRRRWAPIVEIPVKRKAVKLLPPAVQPTGNVQPPVNAYLQPATSVPLGDISSAVKTFLESCNPSLDEFLPLFVNADIKNESSLMALILCPRAERLTFLTNTFWNKMTLEEIMVFNESCELQSQYFA